MDIAETFRRVLFSKRLRAVAGTILRSFVAGYALLGVPLAAATTNFPENESTSFPRTIAERIDTVRDRLAEDGQLPTHYRNSSQKMAQWYNWPTFWNNWNNWPNFWINY